MLACSCEHQEQGDRALHLGQALSRTGADPALPLLLLVRTGKNEARVGFLVLMLSLSRKYSANSFLS